MIGKKIGKNRGVFTDGREESGNFPPVGTHLVGNRGGWGMPMEEKACTIF